MKLNVYIQAVGIISAAGNNVDADFLSAPPDYNTNTLSAKEPDYTGIIPPMQLRRMSRPVRMSIGASKQCLESAGLAKPDAISVGTAMGCLQDTEVFLSKMVSQDEQLLTPTAFIQSTHNTVAGQIALLTGCTGHNLTFSHRGHSFEHAVIDAQLYLHTYPGQTILTGGIDELTDSSFKLMQRAGIYSKNALSANDAISTFHEGAVAGEGAAFLLVSDRPTAGSLHIKSLHSFVARDKDDVLQQLAPYLSENYDLALLGISGGNRSMPVYDSIKALLPNTPQAAFKHLCGEYPTASAFAIALCAHVSTHGVPNSILINGETPQKLRNILVINHFMDYWSCWQLQVV